jgi:hypothetical protein
MKTITITHIDGKVETATGETVWVDKEYVSIGVKGIGPLKGWNLSHIKSYSITEG